MTGATGFSSYPGSENAATSAVLAEAYSMLGLELTVPQARRLAQAALSGSDAQQAVGCSDYVLVPREPTPEMIAAARLAIAGDASALYRSEAASIECFYRAMVGTVVVPSTSQNTPEGK